MARSVTVLIGGQKGVKEAVVVQTQATLKAISYQRYVLVFDGREGPLPDDTRIWRDGEDLVIRFPDGTQIRIAEWGLCDGSILETSGARLFSDVLDRWVFGTQIESYRFVILGPSEPTAGTVGALPADLLAGIEGSGAGPGALAAGGIEAAQAGAKATVGSSSSGGGIGMTGVLLGLGGVALLAAAAGGSGGGSSRSSGNNGASGSGAPASPSGVGLAAASDSGAAGDGITNVRTPTLTGRGEPGSTVELRSAAGTLLGSATVDSAGSFSLTPSSALPEGSSTLQFVAHRGAGTPVSAAAAFTLTIDSTAPLAPATSLGEGAFVNRVENADGLQAIVSGSFTVGDAITIRLVRPDGSVWTATRVATAAEAGAGSASFTVPAQTSEGSYLISASVVDAAGNSSPLSASLPARLDLQDPSVPASAATLSVLEGFAAFELSAQSLGASDNQTASAALTLGGVSFKASPSGFAAGDFSITISGGRATITPLPAALDRNGSFTLTVNVQDEAGNFTPRDVVVSVASVNDAPSGTDATLLVNAGTSYVFFGPDFGFLDARDLPGDGLKSVLISSLPTSGALRLSGAAVRAGQEIALADLIAGKLVYTPAAGANGPNVASFTFQVRDSGGTANGGVDLDPTPNRLGFSVGDFNDPPQLDATRSPAFSTPEFAYSGGGDASTHAPAGASPSGFFLASTLVDFTTPPGPLDNVFDPDAGAKLGLGVTRLANAPGATLWYSVDGGASWSWITNTAGSKVTNGFFGANGAAGGSDDNVLLLASDARLVFDAGTSASGAPIADALTFRAWDQTSGTNGAALRDPVYGNTSSLSVATDTAQANFTTRAIDLTRLDAASGVRIAGTTAGVRFGWDLDGVGDVNGDGFEDFLITHYGSAAANGGGATLVYGRAGAYGAIGADGTRSVALDALPRDSFARPGEFFTGASRVGDLNRDGYADLLLGADVVNATGAGGAYVIFGGPAVPDIPLLGAPSAGGAWFRIADSFYGIGQQPHTISWAGDVNGDGYDDLIFGARFAPTAGPLTFGSGLAVVVYGHAGRSFGADNTLDLAPFGVNPLTLNDNGGAAGHVLHAASDTRGIVIGAGPEGAGLAWASSVGGLGDRNGDGYADFGVIADLGAELVNAIVLHGALTTATGGNVLYLAGPAGQDWVGHGTGFNTGVNSARIRVSGPGAGTPGLPATDPDRITVQGVGDLNGDGFDDFAMAYDGVRNGEVYVIYGSATVLADEPVTTQAAGTRGFRITGVAAADQLGESVRGIGDVNGDGYDDLIVGAPRNDLGAASEQGAAYIIYGGPDAGANDLALASGLATTRGIAIRGSAAGDQAGYAVAGAGDVNGDGLADLLIGAPLADAAGADSGAAWLLYGRTAYGNAAARIGGNLTGSAGADALIGTAANDTLNGGAGGADALSGGAGNDTLTVGSNAWRRVDGGTGFDTLRIGAATTLDFTLVGAAAGQNLSGHTRSIERIDLVAGAQAGSLRIAERDVYALAGDYDAPTGGTLGGRISNTLFVVGDAGDTLSFAEGIGGASGWRASGQIVANPIGDGLSYALYQRGTASVYVDTRMSLADTILGGSGPETLVGGLGSDALYGGGGNDVLFGGQAGSTGATSQAGVRDNFAFSMTAGLAQGTDAIRDFQRGTDRLWLTDVRDTFSPGSGLTIRDVTPADSPTQYVTLAGDAGGALRLNFVSGGASSSVVLDGVLFESTPIANNGRYGSLAELFGTGETRLLYLTAEPFGPGLITLP